MLFDLLKWFSLKEYLLLLFERRCDALLMDKYLHEFNVDRIFNLMGRKT